MSIRDVQIKGIRNGYIVSHYSVKKPKQTTDKCCDAPYPSGEYVEEYFGDEQKAAKAMAALLKDKRAAEGSEQAAKSAE